ncbi:MAG: hypothetical protein HYU39_04015 [Thaumarchaeota archaeon]|nr:hypothetical protein [Nitrososphaerota archaeon]
MPFEESVVDALRVFLGEIGLSYELSARVRGRSNVEHEVFCVVQREGRMVLIELLPQSKLIDEVTVLQMFVKVYDTESRKGVIVSPSHYTEGARKLADLYKISLVTTDDGREAVAQLHRIFHEAFG